MRAGPLRLHTAFNMGKGKGARDSALASARTALAMVQQTGTDAMLALSSTGQSQPIFEITNHLSKKE